MIEARAVKLDEAALTVRETAAAADARSVARVRQLEIDFLDGVNLHVLGEVIHAFEGAHDMDASIPRLVPIATRRLLAKHNGRKVAAGGTAAEGAETASTAPEGRRRRTGKWPKMATLEGSRRPAAGRSRGGGSMGESWWLDGSPPRHDRAAAVARGVSAVA